MAAAGRATLPLPFAVTGMAPGAPGAAHSFSEPERWRFGVGDLGFTCACDPSGAQSKTRYLETPVPVPWGSS